jgi:Xaa-Pro dipeptidase
MVTRRRFLWSAAAAAPALALHAQEKTPDKAVDKPVTPACEEPPLPAPILALTDRTADIVPITIDERNSRLDLARELMKQYGMNAILITTGASLQYYTGAHWGQSERLFAYVIPQSAAPFVICPFLERDHLADLLPQFPERDTTITYLWQENESPFDILRRGFGEVSIAAGTIGVEEHTQFEFVSSIAAACPALKLVSATPVTAGCRSIKSPAEIALLRLANKITFDVYKAVYLSCGPGDTNHKFSDLISKAYARCGVRGDASCNVGPNTAVPHGTGKPQTIHESEMVMIDDGCTVDGYTSDITRSFVYGKPTDLQRAVFEIVLNAQSAALAAAGPGVPMQIVDGAARQVIVKAGYGPAYDFFNHRVGHGIGLDMHEWPYLVQGNDQKMMAGMVFSDEPGIYIPNKFGLRLEDDMVITDHGAELFTWQSPSLLDPFAIPAVLPDKTKDATPTDDKSKPADTPKDATPDKPADPPPPTGTAPKP